LKKSLEKDLPREILYRKKKGFGIPVAQWLKGPLKGEVDRLLSEERLRDGGLFEPTVVNRLVNEHSSGRADHRKAIWTLMMFEYWRERFGATL
jgi:asparagine synthase (glutamine-hydrolysing)